MLSLNPNAKTTREIVLPHNRSIYKEVCTCTDPKHFNVVYQERFGEDVLDEKVITITQDEKLADYIMQIIQDGLKITDWKFIEGW